MGGYGSGRWGTRQTRTKTHRRQLPDPGRQLPRPTNVSSTRSTLNIGEVKEWRSQPERREALCDDCLSTLKRGMRPEFFASAAHHHFSATARMEEPPSW